MTARRCRRRRGAYRRWNPAAVASNQDLLRRPSKKMRLLLLEDEAKTASYIKRGLTGLGYTVDVADDGTEGLFLALEQ